MHETLHKDPTDVSRRKPRRLRGTPANKWTHFISFGAVSIFAIACQLYSEAEWNKPKREHWAESMQATEEEKLRKLMMEDAFWSSAVLNLKKKQEGEDIRTGLPPVNT